MFIIARNALPQVAAGRAHRFDFSVLGIQLLQGAAARQRSGFPHAPERNFRFAQSIQVERVHAFRRRNCKHAPKMLGKKFNDLGPPQIVDPDFKGIRHLREDVSDTITTAVKHDHQ